MKLLAITGIFLFLFAIGTGWLIIARKYLSAMIIESIFIDDEKLVKAHVDYIMMGLILLAFFFLGTDLPYPVILLSCAGALANPSLFIFLAVKPGVNKKTGSPFSFVSTLAFLMTTFGIGGAAFFVIRDLIK